MDDSLKLKLARGILHVPLLVTLSVLMVRFARAQDAVFVSGAQGAGQVKLTGRIVEYTGQQLQLELPGGKRRSIPGLQIARIDTQYGPQHQAADRTLANGQFSQALALYREALEAEPRRWVRRQILAQMVWCYRALGRTAEAGETFLLLVASDPTTPYFDCIPLAWITGQPSVALEQAARQWLARDDRPAAVLLGASHLLSSSDRPIVLRQLQRLAAGTDRRVALLALAQSWRAAVVTADAGQLDAWERTIREMPEPLRPGPYYVLGQARAQKQQWQQAALALMRVPILYPQHRRLAAQCLLDAGRALEKLQCRQEATRLYRELDQRYGETSVAAEARGRLPADEPRAE